MAAHNEMGRWGEDQAVAYLEQQGYTILERDWHSGHRDIDIIALHDGMQSCGII
jgi:putative endonuclease